MSTEIDRPDGPPEAAPAGRFARLRESYHRRSALDDVQAALTRGQLDAEGRAALVGELLALRRSGELSGREAARVERIFRAIAALEGSGRRDPDQGAT